MCIRDRPAASATQTFERYSSRSSDKVVATKATRAPSGEICGSLTHTIRVMSCGTIARPEAGVIGLRCLFRELARTAQDAEKGPVARRRPKAGRRLATGPF